VLGCGNDYLAPPYPADIYQTSENTESDLLNIKTQIASHTEKLHHRFYKYTSLPSESPTQIPSQHIELTRPVRQSRPSQILLGITKEDSEANFQRLSDQFKNSQSVQKLQP